MKAPALGIDPVVALVGGGGLFVWALPAIVGVPGGLPLIGAVGYAVGLFALTRGLGGRPGAFGAARVVHGALLASAALQVVGALAGMYGSVDYATFQSAGFQVFTWSLFGVELLCLATLAVGAIASWTSPGATRDARLGLTVFAAIEVVAYLLPNILVLAVDPELVEPIVAVLSVAARVFGLGVAAVGVWFAWPWLGPRVAHAGAAARRAYGRYRDSTP